MARKRKIAPEAGGWHVKNTADLRNAVTDIADAFDDLYAIVHYADGRPRRSIPGVELFDSLAHLTWSMQLLLVYLESPDHPLGSPGFGLPHVIALASRRVFQAGDRPLTADDLVELERIDTVGTMEYQRALIANVQEMLGLRERTPTLDGLASDTGEASEASGA